MDFIKKLFLIIFLALTTFLFDKGYCSCAAHLKDAAISAPVAIEKILLNTKENECSILATLNTQTNITARRNDNQKFGSSENAIIPELCNDKNLISYFSSNLYLEKKAELALLFLMYQILPNAP